MVKKKMYGDQMSTTTEYHEIMLKIIVLETKIDAIEKGLDSIDRKFETHISQDRGFGFKNWEILVMGLFTILAGLIGAFASIIY